MLIDYSVSCPPDPVLCSHDPDTSEWVTTALQEAYAKAQESPPLRLADVLHEIAHILNKYLYFPHPATAMLTACWIALTYCFKDFKYAGYLAIRSQGPGSGKTRLLELLGSFTAGNPPIFTCPTAAVLYRAAQAVFLIDEVDRLRAQDRQTYGQVLAILNAGFAANGVVPRTEREGNDTKFRVINYPVYGPKAFAGLEKLEQTLADRCFHISMTKAPQRLPRLSQRFFDDTAKRIRNDLAAWAKQHNEQIKHAYVALPVELQVLRRYDDRFQDIAEPLIVLGILADSEYGGIPLITSPLLEGLKLAASQRHPTDGDRLAVALQEILLPVVGDSESLFVPSKQLLTKIQAGGLEWIDSATDLAKALAPFGLYPRSNGTLHGYDLSKQWLIDLNGSRQHELSLY